VLVRLQVFRVGEVQVLAEVGSELRNRT
jgi:hypothetical protein